MTENAKRFKATALQELITQLLETNDIEPTFSSFGQKSEDPLDFDNVMKRQETLMDEMKSLAQELDTLMGRIVKFQMADSYALYVVTKVIREANVVQVTWVKWCDGWQDDRLGYEGILEYQYVKKRIDGEDHLDKLFAQKKAQQ